MRGLSVTLMLLIVGFAGCTDDGPASEEGTVEGGVDEDTFELQAGKGAIEGILVDDRFRPIDLEDEPETEFQTTGFVLLQETGQQVQTDENGQFAFVDLEPGSYTLRVTAEGHEAVPIKVTVEDGLFAEAQVLARRVTTATNFIQTEEYSIFIPCAFVVPGVGLFTLNCVLDLSGESFRSSFWVNYTGLGPDLSYMVAEVHVNQPGNYAMPIRDDSISETENYGRTEWEGGSYGKVIVRNGPEPYQEGMDAWAYNKETNIGLFFSGDVPNPAGGHLGARTGIQGDFMVSTFLGEPEVDIESYCLLCE